MDKAKAAVSDFMHKSGKNDTTVHERVAPNVQHETVNEHREDRRQVATDREIHQDHYHTTVQPVKDREVLPEQHHHNLLPVEHRTIDRRDDARTKDALDREAAQFQNSSVRSAVQHSSSAAPSVTGEHIHHHVHETIQPVVDKQTIEPHVVHTTVPIHEVHHNEARHHAASALPPVSMADFKKAGGTLAGREEKVDRFSGEPKNIERSLGEQNPQGHSQGHHQGHTQSHPQSHSQGHYNDETSNRRVPATGLDTHSAGSGHPQGHYNDETSNRRVPATGLDTHSAGSETAGRDSGIGHAGNTSSKPGKASLLDKLNPKKDADGDGVAGFMK